MKSLLAPLFLMVGAEGANAGSKAYLEVTLKISDKNRPKAVDIYKKYKDPFLKQISGAKSKELLVRDDDVQVLHGFSNTTEADAYLKSNLFEKDIVGELAPLLDAPPEVRIYEGM